MKNKMHIFDSFKAKLIGLMISVTFFSLLVSSVGLTLVQVNNFRNSLESSTLSNMEILSFNLIPMLVFDDSDSAQRLLTSLKTRPHVKEAEVYRIDELGEMVFVARYPEGNTHFDHADVREYITPVFIGEQHYLTYPITLDGDTVGYLYVYSVFDELGKFQLEIIGTVVVIMTVCLLLALVIALKYQAILLRPLRLLVEMTEKISINKDYSLRADSSGNDELSHLALGFNTMLDEIESHDRQQRQAKLDIRQLNLGLEETVKKRTVALELANQSLLATLDQLSQSQNQLVEQEKMASLGGLVAGIAHEINTPVGIGVTAVSHMGELVAKLESEHREKTLRPKDLDRFLVNANECVNITFNNLGRAADLVKSFKQVAVDQSSDSVRTIEVEDYLHEILMSLQPQLKKTKHKVDIHCDPGLKIRCHAGALSQILTNFVMNSLIHGFENVKKGEIKVSITRHDERIFFTYSDDGVGMDADALSRVFEPFYTTRRGVGGSGLGAHVVYNLVTQSLNGNIVATSTLGEGLQFNIDFPEGKGHVAD